MSSEARSTLYLYATSEGAMKLDAATKNLDSFANEQYRRGLADAAAMARQTGEMGDSLGHEDRANIAFHIAHRIEKYAERHKEAQP